MDSFILDIVSWCALFFTVFQFLSGTLICSQIKTKGNTADISAAPFLAGIISCSLWLKYGILQFDHTLITVNTIGLLLQIIYTVFYYWYTVNKGGIHKQLLITCLILFPLLAYLKFYVIDLNESSTKAGFLACCAGVIFCASPLAGIFTVLRTKSTEMLPLPLILTTFVVTLLWFFYGYLLNDLFIQVPNIIGCIIAGMQLSLFVIYPRYTKVGSPAVIKKDRT